MTALRALSSSGFALYFMYYLCLCFGTECEVSHWGKWGDCIGSCVFAMRVRNRIVTKPPFPETGLVKGALYMEPCPPLYQIQQCTPTRCLYGTAWPREPNTRIFNEFAKKQEARSRPVDGQSSEPIDEILKLARDNLNNITDNNSTNNTAGIVTVGKHAMNFNRSQNATAKSSMRTTTMLVNEQQVQKLFKQLLSIQEISMADTTVNNTSNEFLEYEDESESTLSTVVSSVPPSTPLTTNTTSKHQKKLRPKPKWVVLSQKNNSQKPSTAVETTTPSTTISNSILSSHIITKSDSVSLSTKARATRKRKPTTSLTSTTILTSTVPINKTTITTIKTKPPTTTPSTTTVPTTATQTESPEPPDTSSIASINTSEDYEVQEYDVDYLDQNTTIIWFNSTIAPDSQEEIEPTLNNVSSQIPTTSAPRPSSSNPSVTLPSKNGTLSKHAQSKKLSMPEKFLMIISPIGDDSENEEIAVFQPHFDTPTRFPNVPLAPAPPTFDLRPQVPITLSTVKPTNAPVLSAKSFSDKPALKPTTSTSVGRIATGEPGSLYRPNANDKLQFIVHGLNLRNTTIGASTVGVAIGEPGGTIRRSQTDIEFNVPEEYLDNRVLPVVRSPGTSFGKGATITVSTATEKIATGEPGSWRRWGLPDTRPPQKTTPKPDQNKIDNSKRDFASSRIADFHETEKDNKKSDHLDKPIENEKMSLPNGKRKFINATKKITLKLENITETTVEYSTVTAEKTSTSRIKTHSTQRVPVRFNISLPSKNSAKTIEKSKKLQILKVEETSTFPTTTIAPTTLQNLQALLDNVHRPCGDTFGNRRCCKSASRTRCPDGRLSQLAFRWFRQAGTDHCVPYNYGYCGAELEQIEMPIKYQEECYEICYTDDEKSTMAIFQQMRFKDGIRVAGSP